MKIFVYFLITAPLLLATEGKNPLNITTSPEAEKIQQTKEAANWLEARLKEIEKLSPGNTRADLLKQFTYQGGLSTRKKATFVYADCYEIKIDAEFEIVDEADEAKDVIKTLSKPYLSSVVISD